MRDFRDAKAMVHTLREALKAKSVSLTHSESLELIAKILGFHDWNELSAKIQSEGQPPGAQSATAIPATISGARPDLPVVPLRDIVLFPHLILPLVIGRDTSKRALEHAMRARFPRAAHPEDRSILAITQRRPADDNPTPADLYGVGVTASVVDHFNLRDGTIKLLVRSRERVKVVHLVEEPYLMAEIAPFEETCGREEEAIALSRAVLEKFKAVRKIGFLSSPYNRLRDMAGVVENPSVLADAIAPLLSCEISQKQELLETGDVVARLQKVLAIMQTDQQAA